MAQTSMHGFLADTRSLEFLEAALQQVTDFAFLLLDEGGEVVAWLGGAQRILGYSADEMVGTSLARIFTEDDLQHGFDKYELEVARSCSRAEDERWHVRKDGVRIWATGSVSAIHARGRLLGFVKILRDRTDLRSKMDTMENNLASLRASREETNVILRTLGHELRNPLAPLANAARILERTCTDARSAQAVRIVDRQLAVLQRLTDDLLEASRVASGKVHLQPELLDLRQLAAEAAESLQPAALAQGLSLQALLPDGPVLVQADPQRLQQVVLNLLGNALKYTPAGGTVWVKTILEDREAVLRVEDTGIGISPEMLPRIFELFTQDVEAERLVPGGLGVGLALVRNFVELHGGTVQARSNGRGRGSEFTVRLPAAARAPRTAGPQGQSGPG
jgi:PAS domain S-box-containing protein